MAFIHKLKFLGFTIYPATVPQAVVDPADGKDVLQKLAPKAMHGYQSAPKTLKEVDDAKATHGYVTPEVPKTLKEVDTSVVQLAGEVNSDEEVVATDLNGLAERVNALESAFRNMTLTKVQTDTIDVLVNLNFQGRPLFIVSETAPVVAPDGVPQFYINITNGDIYSAKNSTSVADWILK